jgi:hypothetical protein
VYPLIIPVFNNPTYLLNFLNQIENNPFFDIYIYDNASSYPELIEILKELSHIKNISITKLHENLGPHYVLRTPEVYNELPEIFCLSDPDVQFSKQLPNNFIEEMIEISNKYKVGKVGFAIEIPKDEEFLEPYIKMDGSLQKMSEWEKQFWLNQIGSTTTGDPIYLTTLDTQFAVYNKKYFNPNDRYKALRIGGIYTSKHLGFYSKSIVPKSEQEYYKNLSRFAYYIGNFDEEGNPYTKLPVHEYYLMLEENEGLKRELNRVALERDHLHSELQAVFHSNSWKLMRVFREIKQLISFLKSMRKL